MGGFTLVELLVAMVVIGGVAALALSGFSHARAAAKQSSCAGNMRQIGAAMLTYAAENHGWLPTSSHLNPEDSWIFQLEDYLGEDFDKLRICPADPMREQRLGARGTSYILNEYTCVDLDDGFGNIEESFRNLPRLQSPAQTPLVFIAADGTGLSGMNDHTHSRNWHGWGAVCADISPDRHRAGESNDDHTIGASNILFADGRVESMGAEALKRDYFDRGINFAQPPEIRRPGQ